MISGVLFHSFSPFTVSKSLPSYAFCLPTEHVSQWACLIYRLDTEGGPEMFWRDSPSISVSVLSLSSASVQLERERSSTFQEICCRNTSLGHPAPSLLSHSYWDLRIMISQHRSLVPWRKSIKGTPRKCLTKARICSCARRESQNPAGPGLKKTGRKGHHTL